MYVTLERKKKFGSRTFLSLQWKMVDGFSQFFVDVFVLFGI